MLDSRLARDICIYSILITSHVIGVADQMASSVKTSLLTSTITDNASQSASQSVCMMSNFLNRATNLAARSSSSAGLPCIARHQCHQKHLSSCIQQSMMVENQPLQVPVLRLPGWKICVS